MPELQLAAALAGGLLTVAWCLTLLRFHRLGKAFPELSDDASRPPLSEAPKISLVVAARDEEAHVEACVRSLLAQEHPDLELVFVDDRSSDRTPEVLARLESEFAPRLRALRVETLPPEWGGQSHGLDQGAAQSSGEWLCFTDADCRFESPRTLALAWQRADATGASLLSILPRLDAPTLWERAYLPLCSFVLITGLNVDQVNDPQSPAAYANGAFILVRRDAYTQLGGHARVRHLVNDDVALAHLAKQAGLSLHVTGNKGLLRTRMYETLPAAWRGWSRNLYGTLRSPQRIAGALLRATTLFVLPAIGLLTFGALALRDPAWLPVAAVWTLPLLIAQAGLWRLYAACEFTPAWSLLACPGALFVNALLTNALSRSLRRAGTTWHGVHYPHPHDR